MKQLLLTLFILQACGPYLTITYDGLPITENNTKFISIIIYEKEIRGPSYMMLDKSRTIKERKVIRNKDSIAVIIKAMNNLPLIKYPYCICEGWIKAEIFFNDENDHFEVYAIMQDYDLGFERCIFKTNSSFLEYIGLRLTK